MDILPPSHSLTGHQQFDCLSPESQPQIQLKEDLDNQFPPELYATTADYLFKNFPPKGKIGDRVAVI